MFYIILIIVMLIPVNNMTFTKNAQINEANHTTVENLIYLINQRNDLSFSQKAQLKLFLKVAKIEHELKMAERKKQQKKTFDVILDSLRN